MRSIAALLFIHLHPHIMHSETFMFLPSTLDGGQPTNTVCYSFDSDEQQWYYHDMHPSSSMQLIPIQPDFVPFDTTLFYPPHAPIQNLYHPNTVYYVHKQQIPDLHEQSLPIPMAIPIQNNYFDAPIHPARPLIAHSHQEPVYDSFYGKTKEEKLQIINDFYGEENWKDWRVNTIRRHLSNSGLLSSKRKNLSKNEVRSLQAMCSGTGVYIDGGLAIKPVVRDFHNKITREKLEMINQFYGKEDWRGYESKDIQQQLKRHGLLPNEQDLTIKEIESLKEMDIGKQNNINDKIAESVRKPKLTNKAQRSWADYGSQESLSDLDFE